MNHKNAAEILARYRQGLATTEEKALVEDWLTFGDFPDPDATAAAIAADVEEIGRRLPLKQPVVRRLWPRVSAAAAVLLAAGLGWYWLAGEQSLPVAHVPAVQEEVAPGQNRAVLTLAGGQAIPLSSAQTGVVINMAGLHYADGSSIAGADEKQEAAATAYHTVVTPRGGQYQVILEDGTKVWLNAGSSLKFPESFGRLPNREVSLTGEAYFEVAKNSAQPFVVTTPRQQVEVLGTQFNVSCYADEAVTKTTLLQGAVRVTPAGGTASDVLKPGQQSVVEGARMRITAWDTEEAVAWKNGNFDFRNEPLEDILRKVCRWYDVDVVYEGAIPPTALYGKISRSKSLNAVLRVLEISGGVKIKLEGRKLIVSHT
jgi:ferric-dicitrate binding protein FerR (iron transport regulator)